jgi:hypothetical protein
LREKPAGAVSLDSLLGTRTLIVGYRWESGMSA